MIKEDYVSYEVAKLLKEKGFDEPCRSAYIWNTEEYELCAMFSKPLHFNREGSLEDYEDDSVPRISAPTHQMAMKWLRKMHNLFIEPYVIKNYSKKKLEYTYSIQDLDFQGSDDGIECCKNWDTPKQACEAALKYSLENLI